MSSHLDTDLLIYARLLLFYFFLEFFQRRCVRSSSVGLEHLNITVQGSDIST
jgi:hypothetical protein